MTDAQKRSMRKFISQAFAAESFDGDLEVIERKHVIPSRGKGPRPEADYCTLLLVTDERQGYPTRAVVATNDTNRTVTTGSLQYREADFSLQFFYKGAIDRVHRFIDWVESEEGLNAAEDLTTDDGGAFPIRIVQPLQILQTFAGVGSPSRIGRTSGSRCSTRTPPTRRRIGSTQPTGISASRGSPRWTWRRSRGSVSRSASHASTRSARGELNIS